MGLGAENLAGPLDPLCGFNMLSSTVTNVKKINNVYNAKPEGCGCEDHKSSVNDATIH